METLANNTFPQPNFIFVDVYIPKTNGKQCLNEIRASKKLSNIPFIIFSTSKNDETNVKVYPVVIIIICKSILIFLILLKFIKDCFIFM